MSDFFGLDTKKTNKKNQKVRVQIDPIQFTFGTPEFYVLLDKPMSQAQVRMLANFIQKTTGKGFQILSAIPFNFTEEEVKNVGDFYNEHGIDLKKYIPDWSKVITVGRGLTRIDDGDLEIRGFQDTILGHTSFFAPEIKSEIFPLPPVWDWLGKDCWESYFANQQVKKVAEYQIKKKRLIAPQIIEPENPNNLLKDWIFYDKEVAFDLETKTLDPWSPEGRIICLTLCFREDPNTGYYLPWEKIDQDLLARFFRGKKLVGNNLKYDCRWLLAWAKLPRDSIEIYWDNMNSAHTINEMQSSSLKADAWQCTTFGGYEKPLEEYKKKYPKCKKDYSLIPKSTLKPYAGLDAVASMQTYLRHNVVIDELDKVLSIGNDWSIRKFFTEVTMPAVNTFLDIELEGMLINWDNVKKASIEVKAELVDLRKKVYSTFNIPDSVDIDSDQQLGRFIENTLKWGNPGRNKAGIYLVNVDSRTYWKKEGRENIDLLENYSQLSTLFDTFIGEEDKNTGMWQYRKWDNRVHASYSTMMADSGRGKCRDPNAQNIPKHGKYAEIIRSFFTVPSDEFYWSENDAAGLQLRIGGVYSGDKTMRDIFTKYGGDMHSITSINCLRRDLSLEEFLKRKKAGDKEIKAIRSKAKGIGFGLLFGSTAFGFAKASLEAEWSMQEAKDYVRDNGLEKRRKVLLDTSATVKNEDGTFSDKKVEKVEYAEKEKFSYYWAVAEDLRNKFFEAYPGLVEWHKTNHTFAEENGYIKTPFGLVRRLPDLLYIGKDSRKSHISNQKNIAINSPTQSFEAFYLMWGMVKLGRLLKSNSCKSKLIFNVHDSFGLYLHKEEMNMISKFIDEAFHTPDPLMKGIPFEIEKGYSDPLIGEYWGIKEHEWKEVI